MSRRTDQESGGTGERSSARKGYGKKERALRLAYQSGATPEEAAKAANASLGYAYDMSEKIQDEGGTGARRARRKVKQRLIQTPKVQELVTAVRNEPDRRKQYDMVQNAPFSYHLRRQVLGLFGLQRKPGREPGKGRKEAILREIYKRPGITPQEAARETGFSLDYCYDAYRRVFNASPTEVRRRSKPTDSQK